LPKTVSLSAADWITVAVYIALTAGVVVWTRFRQRDGGEDYFLAGRSQNWLVVAVTLFASIFSSISFVAIPGEAFAYGLLYSIPLFLQPLVLPLGIWLFLRFFFFSPTYTAYEYLERRFNAPVRVAGSLVFALSRLIYCGVIFYAAAQLFESLVGWSPILTVLTVGLFTVLYTSHGGMKAVIATDVMQACVLVLGIGCVLWKVLDATDMDVAAIYRFAAANNHGYEAVASADFYKVDLHTRYNFWLLVYMVVSTQLASLSCNQLVVQRLLTSKGYAGAKRAVMFNAIQTIPLVLLFWAVGVGLFYYYRGLHPDRLPPGLRADHVIGHFIATELPSPIPGLIVAALLAAMMGSSSSVVNSIATVVYRDGIVRLGWARAGGPGEMTICKAISVVSGLLAVGIAVLLIVGGRGVQSSVLEVNAIWGGIGSVLLAAFLLGVLVPRVSGIPMFIGCVAGAIIELALPYVLYYNVPPEQRISFVWLSLPGLAVALLLPLALAPIWPQRKDLKGLTLWTLDKQDRPAGAPTPTASQPPSGAPDLAVVSQG
jgi:SSS family transporter